MKKKSKKARSEEVAVSDDGTVGSLKVLLKGDDEFRKYRNIVKHIEATYDLDDLEREARRLHSGRKSRSLAGSTPSADTLIDAQAQDSSNRSRLTQIRVDMLKQDGILEEANDAIRAHLMSHYGEYLPALRTKADRMAHLNQYLRRGVRLKQRISTLMDMLDLYIKDIDQMSYYFSNATEILRMIYNRASTH